LNHASSLPPPAELRPSRLPMPPHADTDLADELVRIAREGYLTGATRFELRTKRGELISSHPTLEAAESAADDLAWRDYRSEVECVTAPSLPGCPYSVVFAHEYDGRVLIAEIFEVQS
jgi:hypothetical protein